MFQSRAGFSECLDAASKLVLMPTSACFNPVLGFLSVSTRELTQVVAVVFEFQSRAGFSECLDCLGFQLPR